MPWGVAAAAVGGAASIYSSNKAASASRRGARTAAGAQQDALDYQMAQEALPSYYRDEALSQLGEYYGMGSTGDAAYLQTQFQDAEAEYNRLNDEFDASVSGRSRKARRGIDKSLRPGILAAESAMNRAREAMTSAPQAESRGQMGLIEDVQQSPFYESMIRQGDASVARTAGMTGGLRSGNAIEAFAQNSQNVLQGLVNQRVGGLETMAGMRLNTNPIAGGMARIGETGAMGDIAAARARQQGIEGVAGAIGQGLQAYGNRPMTPSMPMTSAPNYGYGYGTGTGGDINWGNMSMAGQNTGFEPLKI